MRMTNRAVAGTGFVNPGWTGQPVPSQVADVVLARPRIVFVAAGHNDRRFAASRSDRAADAVIARLHSALPDAILVVIGPIWQDGSPPASLRALRDHLRLAAARVDAIFIDPLRDPWFGGAAHRMIGPDGVHPTDAGHRLIAGLVLRALRADVRFAGRLSLA
jgi:lysophospholipase L1-like esterase